MKNIKFFLTLIVIGLALYVGYQFYLQYQPLLLGNIEPVTSYEASDNTTVDNGLE